ncbi:hypothetical protein WA026_013684 [Henosepilachna vigintioctopunctata]|uniref:Uncharacterized protein n=1 Tax=Henosepilachna vigintioctopunctata TaxID=420089 RepID=A0AAW1UZ91_9CUCU
MHHPIPMEPTKKSKRISCSPRIKTENSQSDNSSKEGKNNNAIINLKKSISKNIQNLDSNIIKETSNNADNLKLENRNPLSQKIRKISKIYSELPDRILKEKEKDLSFYTAANAQIFQTKVAYFPGKNFSEIRQIFNSNKCNDLLNERMKTQNCNYLKKLTTGRKDRTFGKHLKTTKRKSRRMKINLKLLNTIQEVNESEKSNESLKRYSSKDIFQAAYPVKMAYNATIDSKDINEIMLTPTHDTPYTDDQNSKQQNKLPGTIAKKLGSRSGVSYMFQKEESLNTKSAEIRFKHENVKKESIEENATLKKVLQIKHMFESLSQNSEFPADISTKKNYDMKNKTKIEFNHVVSCDECKKMLKDLIETNDASEDNIKSVISKMPRDTVKKFIESLVKGICNDVGEDNISVKIRETKRETQSEIFFQRSHERHPKKRKVVPTDNLQYTNFLLLALAISIVLYCFYCRLDEKKPLKL